MNFAALLALLSLIITDPTGDAIGDGSLEPPTATIYANSALFDLRQVQFDVAEGGDALLRVTLGALGAAAGVPQADDGADQADAAEAADEEAARLAETEEFELAELLAIVDVYIDSGAGGAGRTLEGPNMLLPVGSGWEHAVRISAEGAWGISYVGASDTVAGAPPTSEPGALPDDAEPPGPPSEPDLLRVPLNVRRSGTTLEVELPWQFEPDAAIDLFAMTGVHDPFSPTGWRPLSARPSPWAYFSQRQTPPVIDLLAPDAATQTAALDSGVLPLQPHEQGMSLPLSPWLWLMVSGLAVALLGLVLRGRVKAPVAAAAQLPPQADDDEAEAVEADVTGDTADVVGTVGTLGTAEADDTVGTAQAVAEPTPAEQEHAPKPGPEEPTPTASGPSAPRNGFSPEVEESYLQVEVELVDSVADEDGESFWHPASRAKSTLVQSPAQQGDGLTGSAAGDMTSQVAAKAQAPAATELDSE